MTKRILLPGETRTCPFCSKVFVPNSGRHKFCSKKCISKSNYRKDLPHSREYKKDKSSTPEAIEKQKKNHKKRVFKKYKLENHTFDSLMERQNGKCVCCHTVLNEKNTCIDHNHKTNTIRGLICSRCNLTLGKVQDSEKLLYNLIAYLDRDASKQYVYIIGALKNENIPHVAKSVRGLGYEVFDQWWGVGPEADTYWQKYTKFKGLTYKEALSDYGATQAFHFDRSHLDMSDIGILVHPSGKSAHLELGYLAGSGKKTYILCDGEPDRYDVMPQFANQGVFYKIEDLLEDLKKKRI